MADKWRIEKHDGADKEFRILPPDGFGEDGFYPEEFALTVDYDDVDHPAQDAKAKMLVRMLTAYPLLVDVVKAAHLPAKIAAGCFGHPYESHIPKLEEGSATTLRKIEAALAMLPKEPTSG